MDRRSGPWAHTIPACRTGLRRRHSDGTLHSGGTRAGGQSHSRMPSGIVFALSAFALRRRGHSLWNGYSRVRPRPFVNQSAARAGNYAGNDSESDAVPRGAGSQRTSVSAGRPLEGWTGLGGKSESSSGRRPFDPFRRTCTYIPSTGGYILQPSAAGPSSRPAVGFLTLRDSPFSCWIHGFSGNGFSPQPHWTW